MYWDSDSLPMRFVGLTPFVPVSAELVNHALPLILDIAPIGTIAMLTLVRPRLAPMAIPMLGELRRCVNGELSGSVWKRALELAEQNCDCHYYRSLLRHAPIPLTHWWLSMKFNWMRSRGADLPTFRMLDLILERAVDLAIRSAPRHAHGLSFVYYASIILGLPKFPDLREWCYLDELIPIPTVDNTFHHRIRGKWCPPIAKTFCGKPVILNSTPDEYNDAPSLTDSILRDGRFVHPTCLQSLEGPWYEVGVTLADFPRGDDAETEIDRLRRKTGRNALVRQIISLHGRRPEALLPHLHRLGDHALAREIIDRCPDKNQDDGDPQSSGYRDQVPIHPALRSTPVLRRLVYHPGYEAGDGADHTRAHGLLEWWGMKTSMDILSLVFTIGETGAIEILPVLHRTRIGCAPSASAAMDVLAASARLSST
ncbi:hypothetical protein Pelo_10735 [Pelomyxa schiedti]|nr:hypothetical protein Pelo_10735 [Pelomyxa schiedti]